MTHDCDWSEHHIGTNRYTGSVAAAIERYTDIPAPVRRTLIARMDRRDFDDVVSIDNNTPLEGMNYGRGVECKTVKRGWREGFIVRALRYTVHGYTVLYPEPCGNVVRSTYVPPARPEPAVVTAAEPVDLGSGGQTPISGPVTFAQAASNTPELVSFTAPAIAPFVISLSPGICCEVVKPPHVPAVPEPKTWLLFLAGAIALRLRRLAGC